jgi:hypothetical protein
MLSCDLPKLLIPLVVEGLSAGHQYLIRIGTDFDGRESLISPHGEFVSILQEVCCAFMTCSYLTLIP